MASGEIALSGSNLWTGKISWSSTQDVANNRSTVTATLYTWKTNSDATQGTTYFQWQLSIGSNSWNGSYDTEYPSVSTRTTQSATIEHNSDGTCSVTISAKVISPGGNTTISNDTLNGSATVDLGTIARASTLTVNTKDVQMGKQLILTINRQDASFKHAILYAPNGITWYTIAGNVDGSYSWTVPDLASQCTNYTSLAVYLKVETYTSAGAYIGSSFVTGAYTDGAGNGYVLALVQDPSTPSISGDVTMGVGKAISCPRNSTNFTVKLAFTLGSQTEAIVEDKVDSYTWTPSYNLAKEIPTLTIATGTLVCSTYNGTALVGQKSIAVRIIVPDNDTTKPSFSASGLALSVVTELTGDLATLYIRGRTGLKAAFTATSAYSTITSYSITAGTVSASGNPATIDVLVDAGTVSVTAKVTDARGFSRSVTTSIYVHSYSKPKVIPYTGYSDVICERAKESGELSPTGTLLAIKAGRSFSSFVINGTERNECALRFRLKVSSAEWAEEWTTLIAASSTDTEISAIISGITLSTSTSYDVQVEAIDALGGKHILEFPIMTEHISFVLYDGEDGAGFGKYPEAPHVVDIAAHMTLLVRGKLVVLGEDWNALSLADGVYESASAHGRVEDCKYQLSDGNHVYVAFNCSFTHSGTTVTINASAMPSEVRPAQTVCGLCPVDNAGIAMVAVDTDGYIRVEWVKRDGESGSHSVLWIDGYLDYWI